MRPTGDQAAATRGGGGAVGAINRPQGLYTEERHHLSLQQPPPTSLLLVKLNLNLKFHVESMQCKAT